MTHPLGKLDTTDFLRDHWQKEPLLLRQAIPDFTPELGIDDIAGLPLDELAESRVVRGSYPEHDWKLEYGPFDEKTLRSLPDKDWTLLVQDVEKHYPPLRHLVEAFDFLPRWRVDDLMVSVAAPGGSVGPHTDQYDVFLLQAEGRRHWQIAKDFSGELLQGTELNVLNSFESEQEWILEPGDMLYLPPGIAHHGVALDTCMTWSIGLRAPSTADILQAFGEWLAAERGEGARYADPDLGAGEPGAELDEAAIARFGKLLAGATAKGPDFTEFLGTFLSRYRLAHEPLGPERPLDPGGLTAALGEGHRLRHNPWTRLLWTSAADGAKLFAAGSSWPCTRAFATAVCDAAGLEKSAPELADQNAALLCELVNAGHLYLEAPA